MATLLAFIWTRWRGQLGFLEQAQVSKLEDTQRYEAFEVNVAELRFAPKLAE